ncbi:MAG: DUF4926 domain-containing protein [Chloroflexi bacterium]|nr:DUF4926 domain-containing protein [Chloroflexota bacterium]
MIKELDTIVLSHDVEEHGLEQGDIGAVVYVYKNEAVYEIEFITGEGETVAVLTLAPKDIRPMNEHEIPHVRELIPA